jgi:hypothetical protein
MKALPLALFVLAGAAASALAQWSGDFSTVDGSGVSATVQMPFDLAPPSGLVPVTVRIENAAPTAQTWTWQSSSDASRGNSRWTETASERLRVGARDAATFHVLVPVCSFGSGGYGGRAQFFLLGPGIADSSMWVPGANSSGTGFLGMSGKLATRSWGPLKEFMEKKGGSRGPLRGSSVDVTLLGEDWRGLLGMRSFWLTDAEYVAMSPAQRLATREWVLQGGEVFFCADSDAAPLREEFGVAAGVESAAFGLGRVHFRAWDGRELVASEVVNAISIMDDAAARRSGGYGSSWMLASRVPTITWNVPLLGAGLLAFALVIGPVNLFWFAGAGRRHRLFWTTPFISVLASAALGALIVLQDGFGGSGARVMLAYLDPALKRKLVLQEQIARTGVLSRTSFRAGDAGWLEPLPISDPGRSEMARNATYAASGGEYSGDWFSTRWRQGLFAEALTPSRAEIRWTPSASGAPEIHSSLSVTLSQLVAVDAEGRFWEAKNIRPGGKVVLQEAGQGARDKLLASFPAGPRLQIALDAVRDRRAFFYALAENGEFLPTLPSIRWHDNTALYCGPLVIPPTP